MERDLYPVEDTTKYLVKVPYQMELTTSDISSAGYWVEELLHCTYNLLYAYYSYTIAIL